MGAPAFEPMALATIIRTNVPIISLSKLAGALRIAGEVQKQARLRSGSGVTPQCGPKSAHTRAAPAIAPSSCAIQ